MAEAQHTIIGVFITADRDVLLLVLLLSLLLALAGVALVARQRKWPELASMFFLAWIALIGIAHLFFWIADTPFARVDTVSITTTD